MHRDLICWTCARAYVVLCWVWLFVTNGYRRGKRGAELPLPIFSRHWPCSISSKVSRYWTIRAELCSYRILYACQIGRYFRRISPWFFAPRRYSCSLFWLRSANSFGYIHHNFGTPGVSCRSFIRLPNMAISLSSIALFFFHPKAIFVFPLLVKMRKLTCSCSSRLLYSVCNWKQIDT